MTIDVLGDRRNTGYCLNCGTFLLIKPWNEYQCCPACTDIMETVSRRELNRKKTKKDGGGRMVILKPFIRTQLRPMPKED